MTVGPGKDMTKYTRDRLGPGCSSFFGEAAYVVCSEISSAALR